MSLSAAAMEIQLSRNTGSPSPSSSDHQNSNPNQNGNPNPMQSWWEAISKARSRIQALSSILPSFTPLSSLADSDRPARSLLESPEAYLALASSLSDPFSGSGDDPLCQWLYETFQSSDPDLRLVVLSFIPLLAGLYLSRVVSTASENPTPSLAGFEAVLLALYASETKARGGKPMLISIPDLSQPSLYHAPRNQPANRVAVQSLPSLGVLCPPLEPQMAVKSTKRACIVAIALECYFKQIPQMPSWCKVDLCQFAAGWAGQNCSCKTELDGNSEGDSIDANENFVEVRVDEEDEEENDEIRDTVQGMNKLAIVEDCNEIGVFRGSRIPLPWELLQPVLRILGHCLLAPLNLQDVRDAASVAVRCLYARASHDLVPQAILATRSLIQLDNRARFAAKEAAAANAASNANTPSKAKKPEILLVSK
ncbi:uncharacterized protein LOC122669625 [Telopea speciosissima]|uniref:uncharacterized protein LOC122669625 n=1 Tax=Telopea speciosissima TaxID=54955 RepID=UPI001CC709E3|nr:uncharacterized protein LOC122669625 [Telopea speciosissima]